jgi:hypothetical protein
MADTTSIDRAIVTPMNRLYSLLLIVGIAAASGCRSMNQPGAEPPKSLTQFRWSDANQVGGSFLPIERQATQTLNAALCVGPYKPQPTKKPLNVLVVSAGGKYSAFVSGQLVGWSERGDRPVFDIATGVSGGIIPAVYGFLGPKYDATMQRLFLTLQPNDLFKYNPFLYLPWKRTIGTAQPLDDVLKRELTCEMVEDLAQAFREGRRCLVATMNLHTRRLAIWDITAIAASGRDDRQCLIRKIMVAGCSIPGFVDAVDFDVTVDGCRYTESHCDGGAVCQAFFRLTVDQTADARLPAPEGSRLFCMSAGKLYVDPVQGELGLVGKIRSATTATLYALHRGNQYQMYTVAIAAGMKYHLTALPADFEIAPESMKMDPQDMPRLYRYGLELGRAGLTWRNAPPGSELNEEEFPRTGTDFKIDNTLPGALLPIPAVDPPKQLP